MCLSSWHLYKLEIEKEHSFVLGLIEFIVLPREIWARILSFKIVCRILILVFSQHTIVTKIVVSNRSYSTIYAEKCTICPNKLVSSHLVAVDCKCRILELAVVFQNTGSVLEQAERDNLHVQVVCNQIIADFSVDNFVIETS